MEAPHIRAARAHGAAVWAEVLSKVDQYAPEFPANPYGDEWQNPPAQAFRKGFDEAARRDGYTYSRVTGDYEEGGEHATDEHEISD